MPKRRFLKTIQKSTISIWIWMVSFILAVIQWTNPSQNLSSKCLTWSSSILTRSLISYSQGKLFTWPSMVSHQEPRWTSNDLEDSELRLMHKRRLKESPVLETSGLTTVFNSLEDPRKVEQPLTQMSSLLVQNLCTTSQKHSKFILLKGFTAGQSGKTCK